MTTKNTLCTIILLFAASALHGQITIERWDFISNSLVGVNGNNMTFVNTGSTDQTGAGFDNSFTVNRGSGYGGVVLPDDLGRTGGTVKAEMTFSSWELSSANAFFAIDFREKAPDGYTPIAQLRFQGNTAGTRVTLDGEIGQITDSNGGARGTAIGGFVSAARAATTPVTIILTLDLDDGSYLIESDLWTTQNAVQQSGTIEGLSGATIDNFRWINAGGWVSETDFVELDQIEVSSLSAVPEPSTYALLAGLLSLSAVMIRRRSV